MARTLRNENGVQITVAVGDVVRMRSGNSYLMVEVPEGGASGPANWPTGVGVRGGSSDYQDIMLDRISQVHPGTPASRRLAEAVSLSGFDPGTPDSVATTIRTVRELNVGPAGAGPAARTASAPGAGATGNS